MRPAISPLTATLDPARNAVVSACAGSGKTWLLVSRMIRLLIAGAEPGELLAITFTRKAAEEMRERLYRWLERLAVASDEEALDFLVERGLEPGAARAALPVARGLFEKTMMAAPGPMITTFHGWFLHLLGRAPLEARGPVQVLEEAPLLEREAWLTFAEGLGRRVGEPEEQAFAALLAEFPLSSVRELLSAFLHKRAEWWAWAEGRADPVGECMSALTALAGVTEGAQVLDELAEAGLLSDLRAYLPLLARNGQAVKDAAARAQILEAALDRGLSRAQWDILQAVFLTQRGEARVLKPSRELDKRLGPEGAVRFIELHGRICARILAIRARLAEQRALALNRWALTAGLGLLGQYQRLKSERDVLDFTDAEWGAWRLLSDEETGPAVLARLDARWRHILIDEFQDTNPLQWRILRAWLEAYGADGERPTLFLVGDPKQSIYRFRRAEPRLFDTAADWLARDWEALVLPNDTTRRLAPAVAAWVNAVFAGREDYPGFHPHTAHQAGLPGLCEVIVAPRGGAVPDDAPPDRSALRNPLVEPAACETHARAEEAHRVAGRIRAMVGRLAVREGDRDRAARYADIIVLSASRTHLPVFEAAFKAAGIPFVTSRRGGLLDSLEAADLIALLTWLVSPGADLALAHVLRSPVFAWSDEALLALADRPGGAWTERLAAWAAQPQAPAYVLRAWTLLSGWQARAGRVPAHDLLDRVFHEGEVEARYAAAVPEHLRPGVLANLRGLIALSLEFSGGRYPSLPRFLDELKALRDRAGDEAPDEPPAAAGDAVRLLTIHAAKGLEAPIVFLIKADEADRDRDHYGVLLDWPPERSRPTHFSLYGRSDWRGTARDALFAQENALQARERLNLLYVAMTRAKQVLVVSGLEGAAEGSWLQRVGEALARVDLSKLPMVSELPAPAESPVQPPPAAPVPHAVPPVGACRPAEAEEAVWGTLVHRYLELTGAGWGEAALRTALGVPEEVFERVREAARRILEAPALRRFFDPAQYRWAHNELEFVDAGGELRRIDRLVAFDDELWVLDYKTGGLAEPDPTRRAAPYLGQMDAYRQAMARLYPGRRVRCALIFAEGSLHEL